MSRIYSRLFLIKSLRCKRRRIACAPAAPRQPVSRTCTCALEVVALVKDIGEEGPWDDMPVRRYTFSRVYVSLQSVMTCPYTRTPFHGFMTACSRCAPMLCNTAVASPPVQPAQKASAEEQAKRVGCARIP